MSEATTGVDCSAALDWTIRLRISAAWDKLYHLNFKPTMLAVSVIGHYSYVVKTFRVFLIKFCLCC